MNHLGLLPGRRNGYRLLVIQKLKKLRDIVFTKLGLFKGSMSFRCIPLFQKHSSFRGSKRKDLIHFNISIHHRYTSVSLGRYPQLTRNMLQNSYYASGLCSSASKPAVHLPAYQTQIFRDASVPIACSSAPPFQSEQDQAYQLGYNGMPVNIPGLAMSTEVLTTFQML